MSEFLNAINKNSEAQQNITENEWGKIKAEKEDILLSIKDSKLKEKFELKYSEIDNYFADEWEQIYDVSKNEIKELKDLLVNDKEFKEKRLNNLSLYYWVDVVGIEKSFNENQGLSVINILQNYKNYIEIELVNLFEWCDVSKSNKEKLIQNIKNIIVWELPQNSKWENKWILNWELTEKYSKIFKSVFKSAKFYILMHTSWYKEKFEKSFNKNIYFKSHVSSRLKEIEKALIIEKSDGKISSWILFNDNMIIDLLSWANNDKYDRIITGFDFWEWSINNSIENNSLYKVNFLNEKDNEIEKNIWYKMLWLSLISSFTPLDIGFDIVDTFSPKDATLIALKELQKKVDLWIPEDYQLCDKNLWENALSWFALIPLIWNIGDVWQVLIKLKKVWKLDIWLLKKSLNDVWNSFWIDKWLINEILDKLEQIIEWDLRIDKNNFKLIDKKLKKSLWIDSNKLKLNWKWEFVRDKDSELDKLLQADVKLKSDHIKKTDFEQLLDQPIQLKSEHKLKYTPDDDIISKATKRVDELLDKQKKLKIEIKEINDTYDKIYDEFNEVWKNISNLWSVFFSSHIYKINTDLNKIYDQLIDLRKLHRIKQKELTTIEQELDVALIKTPEEIVEKMIKSINFFEKKLDIMFNNIFSTKKYLQKKLNSLPGETKTLDWVTEFKHLAA